MVIQECAHCSGKSAHHKHAYFFENGGLLIFFLALCFLPFAARSLKHGPPTFLHEAVLSVSVVPSVSVESAMESQLRVNEVFCAASLSGTLRSLRINVQKSRLQRQSKLFACRGFGPQFAQ